MAITSSIYVKQLPTNAWDTTQLRVNHPAAMTQPHSAARRERQHDPSAQPDAFEVFAHHLTADTARRRMSRGNSPTNSSESAVKVSVATPLNRCKGGQFVAHVKAMPGNPYDGHMLATVIPQIEISIGTSLSQIVADAGYRGHNAPKNKAFKVYVAGQKRGLSAAIKRAFRRRSAIEPVIGHLKNEHRMNRNYLVGTHGDAAKPVLAAAGFNFRLLLRWLAYLCAWISAALDGPTLPKSSPQPA